VRSGSLGWGDEKLSLLRKIIWKYVLSHDLFIKRVTSMFSASFPITFIFYEEERGLDSTLSFLSSLR
jgi:hypothetical protein